MAFCDTRGPGHALGREQGAMVYVGSHLVQGFHHAYHVIEDNYSLPLAKPLLLDDVVLQVDQVSSLVTEVVCTEAVQDKADALLHLLNHSVRFCILNDFTGAVLRGEWADRAWLWTQQAKARGLGLSSGAAHSNQPEPG